MAIRIPVIPYENQQMTTASPKISGGGIIPIYSNLESKLGISSGVQGLVNQVMVEVDDFKQKQKAINQATEIAQTEIDVQNVNQENVRNLRLNPNPDTYYSDWQSGYQQIAKDRLSKIADPETRAKANIALQRMQLQEMGEQKHYGNVLWISTKQGQIDRLLDQYEKIEDVDSGLFLLDQGILGGIYKPDVGEQKKIEFKNRIEKQIRKNNLKLASGEVEASMGLATEEVIKKYDISEEDAIGLRKRSIELEEKAERKETKAAKDYSAIMTADLTERIRVGEDVGNIISAYAPHNGRLITSEDYEKLLRYVDAKKSAIDEDPDPDLAREVKIKSNLAVPTISEQQVVDLMRSRKIGGKTGEKALDQIRSTSRYWREEGQQEYMKDYSEAQKTIFRGFGMTGLELELIEKIDPAKKRLIDDALRQLYDRTLGSKKRENPMAVAREIVPFYQQGIEGENMLSIESYKKLLGNYKTKQELNSAYEAGQMKWDEYKQKLIYMREMEKRLNEVKPEVKSQKGKFER